MARLARYVGAMLLFGVPLFFVRNLTAKADTDRVDFALRCASTLIGIMMPMLGMMRVNMIGMPMMQGGRFGSTSTSSTRIGRNTATRSIRGPADDVTQRRSATLALAA